jgi:hypothetical protein
MNEFPSYLYTWHYDIAATNNIKMELREKGWIKLAQGKVPRRLL